MRRVTRLLPLPVCLGGFFLCVTVSLLLAAPAGALELEGFNVAFTGPGGEAALTAGAHPYAMTTSFEIAKKEEGGKVYPTEALKNLQVYLPLGVAGVPSATPRCTAAEFFGNGAGTECPIDSAVGTVSVEIGEAGQAGVYPDSHVYNLQPSPGDVAELGFETGTVHFTIDLTVSESPPYRVIATLRNISQVLEVFKSELTVWGVPGDPAHEAQRGGHSKGEAPFLVNPRACEGPLSTVWQTTSWQHPADTPAEGSVLTNDPLSGVARGFSGCSELPFGPSIVAKPTSKAASSPSGLDFKIEVPDPGLTNPTGRASADIEKVVVTLPEGMTINPSQANGLQACSEAQLAKEKSTSQPGEGCPQAAKIGSVEVETPALPDTVLDGSLYVATPYENPFGSLVAFYIVIKNPQLGILIVQPAKVEADPVTGRLVSVSEDMPQLPFSHFRLHFREGARSPLVSPPACGAYTTTAMLYPYSGGAPVTSSSMFEILTGTNEGACPAGGVPPFKPVVVGGTENNAAGSYSPFYLRIERKDEEQEITGFATQLPAGVTGNLTGIPFCTEAEIAHARVQTGAQAEADPACPAASQIGRSVAEAGVGTVLAQTPGALYLAGPFEGAPFSVVDITSAKVGPFDLGTVVVHLPLRIDPLSAQVSIPSGAADQIPHIIDGIVIHLRTIRVYIDRQRFMINPTSCQPMSLSATVIGSGASFANPNDDVPASVSDPFQTADCSSLAFKPGFSVSTSAKASRKDGASLNVSLTYPKEALGKDANIHRVKVELPKALPSRLSTLQKACTEAQFNANPAGCPAESVVGHARAITPILPVPLEGPAYFVSRGAEWPELIMVLQGYGLTIDLHGETHISKGVTSSTFPAVPDQPVESFQLTLPEGPYSALAAPGGKLCQKKLIMPTSMTGQNGAGFQQATRIQVQGCPDKLLIGAPKIKGRKLELRVSVPAAGRLTATGKGLGKASRKASGRETLTLALKRHGRASHLTKVRLSFTPSSGTSRKKLTSSIAVKPAHKRHKHATHKHHKIAKAMAGHHRAKG